MRRSDNLADSQDVAADIRRLSDEISNQQR
jgi:hypothetical protein